MKTVKHIPSGIIGTFVKEIPSNSPEQLTSWLIKLDTGGEYMAPKNEFILIQNSPN